MKQKDRSCEALLELIFVEIPSIRFPRGMEPQRGGGATGLNPQRNASFDLIILSAPAMNHGRTLDPQHSSSDGALIKGRAKDRRTEFPQSPKSLGVAQTVHWSYYRKVELSIYSIENCPKNKLWVDYQFSIYTW